MSSVPTITNNTSTVSSFSTSVVATPATITSLLPTFTRAPDPGNPVAFRTSYLSSTSTGLIACLTLMIGLMYLVVLSWAWRYGKTNPRPLNKTSGVRVQRWAPVVYVFLVLTSLAEVAITSWLVLQYRWNHNYPNLQIRTAAALLLFASSWTTLSAGAYTLLFLHPTWYRHPVASIGAQAIWIFVTWLFWVVGAGLVNAAIPGLMDKGLCQGVVYCAQIRSLFGE
ncbi:hypothetical protein B0H34DRAFT_666609 [Crassisporium funariophilum]|nr:hypothetical protein B0H34DRAFT_666609 [Crassisporium funariophilum]